MANTQFLDNNLNFKFVWLNSAELVHLQSRGLSLEVCGYLPISLRNKPNYLRDMFPGEEGYDPDRETTILDIGNELIDYRISEGNTRLLDTAPMTFIFPGMEYSSNGKYVLQNTTSKYKEWLVNYQDHLFTNIRALNSAEMKFTSEDLDEKFGSQGQTAAAGSIQLSFDIKNETFGTYIKNSFYIDAIMIFGQAYNDRAYRDLTQEEQIQKIVPIGLLVYADDRELDGDSEKKQRPFIQPGKMNGVVVRETLVISLLQGNFKLNGVQNDDAFKTWSAFAGKLHLVNDNLSTSAKLLLTGNKVTKKKIDDILTDTNYPTGDDGLPNPNVLSANDGRTFALHDRLYMARMNDDWDDSNDDFSSPALITCMNDTTPGDKLPQLLLGEVTKNGIKGGYQAYTGNTWDGVAHSYWTDSVDYGDKKVSAAVYDIDWISWKRPGLNLFCNNIYNTYWDKERLSDANVSATFGGGFNLMSQASHASRYSTNILSTDSYLRGDAVSFGSNQVHYYQSGFNAEEIREDRKKNNGNVGAMFINSEYLNIASTGGGRDQLTTIAADNIWLYGTGENKFKDRKITVVNAEWTQLIDSNRLLVLNTKGKRQGGAWTPGGVTRSSNSIIANGYNMMNCVDKGIIVGDQNYMFGASFERLARNCQIFGSDNRISSVNTAHGEAKKITIIGHGLNSDPRQQIFERTDSPCKTIILGQDNNTYTQLGTIGGMSLSTLTSKTGTKDAKGKKGLSGISGSVTRSFKWDDYTNRNIYPVAVKQLVIGGWKPATVRHKIQKYNMAEFSVDNTILNDSIMTLMDIKGRAVDYTSRGVNVAVQDIHSQESYDYYQYRQIGGINWAKLIQLLYRLEYDKTTKQVKYNAANKGLNDPDNRCGYHDDFGGSTKLYDLVRNDVGVGPLPNNF